MRHMLKAFFAAAAVLLVTQASAQVGTVFPLGETQYNIPRPHGGIPRPSKESVPTGKTPTSSPIPTATPAPTATPTPAVSVEDLMTTFDKITGDSKAFKKQDGKTQLAAKYQEELGALFTQLAASKFSGRPELAKQLANHSALALRKNFGEAANLKNLTQTTEGKQKLFETGLGLLQGALQKDSDALANTLELLREKNANLTAVMESLQGILVADPANTTAIEADLASAEQALSAMKVSRSDRERLLTTLREVNKVSTFKTTTTTTTTGSVNSLDAAPAPTPALRPFRTTRKSF